VRLPVLGIPAGAKMQSGAFAVSPEAAGRILAEFVQGEARLAQAEVMDLDETAAREGRIEPRLHGQLLVPALRGMQAAKGRIAREGDDSELQLAAAELARTIRPDALVIVGPGRSAKALSCALGASGTLLGVDVLRNRGLVGRDLSRVELDALLDAHGGEVRLVLGITGAQGFLLGRGNQVIGPKAIRRAGREGLAVLATAAKLATLARPALFVDTGDPILDAELRGFVRVRTGPGRETLLRIDSG
jgi:predicted polyphosphate/ATP-dependent NAD kinase